MAYVRYSSKVLKTSPICWMHWRAVKCSRDCTAPIILTGICPRFCVSQGGLLIPLTRGQDTHTESRERGSQLMKFLFSKTWEVMVYQGLDQALSQPVWQRLLSATCHAAVSSELSTLSPGSCIWFISSALHFSNFSVIASDGGNTKKRGFY